jgi:hypothetical protein
MRRTALALTGLLLPAALAAQSGQSTARAVGMGRSMTASARGYEAVVWNPALLGAPGRPKFSINILQAGVTSRSNVLSPNELWNYYTSDSLSLEDKNAILDKVRATDDSAFGVGALGDVMAIGVTVGSFGVTLSGTAADVDAAVSDDAIELALLGNTGRRAPGERYDAAGTRGSGVSAATLAVAWGQGFQLPVGHLALGVTAKLRRGVFAARAGDLGSYVQNAPSFDARAGVHAVYFDLDSTLNNGTGFGLDLGAAYDFASGVRIAAAMENLVSSMSWKDENLRYIREEYLLQQSEDGLTYRDSTISDIDGPYDSTDATQKALRDSLLGADAFATKLRLGAQLSAGPVLLAGDAVFELTDGIVPGASSRASVGAELPISVMALRGGLATDFDGGIGFSLGLGFKLGPVRVDFGGAVTPGGDRKGFTVATGISVMN